MLLLKFVFVGLSVHFVFCFGLSVELGGLGEEAEDKSPPRRLVKEVSGLVKDGLSQHSKGEGYS